MQSEKEIRDQGCVVVNAIEENLTKELDQRSPLRICTIPPKQNHAKVGKDVAAIYKPCKICEGIK